MLDGYTDGYSVTDNNNFFSSSVVGNYLVIHSPIDAAGYYKISEVSEDHHTLYLDSGLGILPLPAFASGTYEILNTTTYRNGLQNGFFTFEIGSVPREPYRLTEGWYELDYYSYLSIPFGISSNYAHIGSDFTGHHQVFGTLDELQ